MKHQKPSSKVISIHEYVLSPAADPEEFKHAILSMKGRLILELEGLRDVLFLQGVKGVRDNLFSAVWIYESIEDWEALWGEKDKPKDRSSFPSLWLEWENEILSPFLAMHPDEVDYTAYIEVK